MHITRTILHEDLQFILDLIDGIRDGKYLLKTPGNTISETLNFKTTLDAAAFKNLHLWCKFQSRLVHIISLLLKNFLTALGSPLTKEWMKFSCNYWNFKRCVGSYVEVMDMIWTCTLFFKITRLKEHQTEKVHCTYHSECKNNACN